MGALTSRCATTRHPTACHGPYGQCIRSSVVDLHQSVAWPAQHPDQLGACVLCPARSPHVLCFIPLAMWRLPPAACVACEHMLCLGSHPCKSCPGAVESGSATPIHASTIPQLAPCCSPQTGPACSPLTSCKPKVRPSDMWASPAHDQAQGPPAGRGGPLASEEAGSAATPPALAPALAPPVRAQAHGQAMCMCRCMSAAARP